GVDGKSFRLADEVLYIQQQAAEHDGRSVTVGELVLFSTETGDAWLRDAPDHLAARFGPRWRSRAYPYRGHRHAFRDRVEGAIPHRGRDVCLRRWSPWPGEGHRRLPNARARQLG